jgi:hypothetical protein
VLSNALPDAAQATSFVTAIVTGRCQLDADDHELTNKPYLSSFKKYADEEPTSADRNALNIDLYSASDRAAAVLWGSLVDRAVERLIRTAMRPKGVDDIFDHNGPCGSFSNKIQIAYALELFGTKTRHDLNLIRTLRNGFAHSRKPMRFTTPVVRKICDRLMFPDFPNVTLSFEMLDKTPKRKLPNASDKKHPRTRYFTTCNEIARRIWYVRGGSGDEDLNELP